MKTSRFSTVLLACSLVFFGPSQSQSGKDEEKVYTLATALEGSAAPKEVRDSMRLVELRYWGFDNREHQGQLVVNMTLADDVRLIFHDLDSLHFPIRSIVPIVAYDWSDDASIAKNNTSCFNYRRVNGTSHLSMHAFGRAIDLNPYLNPWIGESRASPRPYNTKVAGTIAEGSEVVKAFTKRGWTWGGSWARSKDYQHFEKR